jgi:hypothetical protein
LEERIRGWLTAQVDLTLAEICQRLADLGITLKGPALWNQLNQWGLSYKKTRHASEQAREDVRQARDQWIEEQPALNPEHLKFIDKTGGTTNMTRLRGRSPRGSRCVASVPHGHRKTTTLIATLGYHAIIAPLVMDGPTDGAMFEAYVRTFLCPTLRPGDGVIADNLSCHKVAGIKEAIEAVSARILYQPPYSLDFNPSRKCSQSSRHSSAAPPNEPSIPCGQKSARFSMPSLLRNAKITSLPVDM